MRTFFVSRHRGAMKWLQRQVNATEVVELDEIDDLSRFRASDRVFGVLPLEVAAALCDRGVAVHAISVRVPRDWRGRELSVRELALLGARLVRYTVIAHDTANVGTQAATLASCESGFER